MDNNKKKLVMDRLDIKIKNPSQINPNQVLHPRMIHYVYFEMYGHEKGHSPYEWLMILLITYHGNPSVMDDYIFELMYKYIQAFTNKEIKIIKKQAKAKYKQLLREQKNEK